MNRRKNDNSDLTDLTRGELIEQITALREAAGEREARFRRADEKGKIADEELQAQNESLSAGQGRLVDNFKGLTRAHTDILNLLDSVPAGIILLDRELRLRRINDRAGELTSLDQDDVGRPIADVIAGLGYRDLVDACRDVLAAEGTRDVSARTPDGRWYVVGIAPYRTLEGDVDGLVLTLTDVTPLKEREVALREALREKETLLRELYHRTKNNMQVIVAMLELQGAYIENEEMLRVLEDVQNRIQSMALVHEKLYQSEDLSTINLSDYLKDLSLRLMESHGIAAEKVLFSFDTDDIFVLIDTAIPCGLVVNEIINNALVHAFPGDRQGRIDIGVHRDGDREVVVTVADNGVGLPDGFDSESSGSLGLLLVKTVGERQLQGKIHLEASDGVTFELRFKDDLYRRRV